MTFEDPTDLVRCIQSDCDAYRAGNTPFCARHLRDQEMSAGATSIVEPELEARVAMVRTEDDDHPGEKKIYNDDGTTEWVKDEDWKPPAPRLFVGPDPDTYDKERAAEVLRLDVPTWNERVGIDPLPERFRPAARSGCWVAYHSDWSALALFDDELEALRYAVAKGMSVRQAGWGEELPGGH